MAERILTKNGIDNTNIDGARFNFLTTGRRSGFVKNAFSSSDTYITNTSNSVTLNKCELLISGHRIVVDDAKTITFSSAPSSDTEYSLIASISVSDTSDVTFDLFVQSSEQVLITDNLFATDVGDGTYQIELAKFVLKTDLTIDSFTQTASVIETGAVTSVNGQTGDVEVPKGDTGPQGPVGPQGPKGDKGDSGVASGTVNSNTPGTSQTDGYTQYAVNNIVSNPNLLINSNFAINQRGKTSYPATDKYTVDRWINNGTTCTLATKGVTISVPTAWKYYGQQIEDYANLKGETVTFTVKISALTYTTGTPAIRISDGVGTGYKSISTVGVHSVTLTVNDNATQLNILAIYNSSNNSSDIVATIEWAKLEIGSVTTVYTPPLISEELPKCQRYYHIYATQSSRPTNMYDCVPTMRTTPTQGTVAISGTTYYYNDAEL